MGSIDFVGLDTNKECLLACQVWSNKCKTNLHNTVRTSTGIAWERVYVNEGGIDAARGHILDAIKYSKSREDGGRAGAGTSLPANATAL
jgi:hypothetical protein